MHLNCCSMNGPRGFLSFLRSVVQARDSRFGDGLLNERIPTSHWAFEKPKPFETPRFESVQCPARDMDMAFVATMRMGAHQKAVGRDVHFCDFASASAAASRAERCCLSVEREDAGGMIGHEVRTHGSFFVPAACFLVVLAYALVFRKDKSS